MITSKFFSAARMSRVLTGGAALVIAAAITSFAPPAAHAAGKALYNNGTGCASFSSFRYDATTNTLTLDCMTVTIIEVPGPASYSVALSTTSTVAGTSVGVTLNRSGGTPAESVDLSVIATTLSGWSFNGVGSSGWQTLQFAAGEASKSMTFSPGTSAGSLTLQLGGVIGTSGSTTNNNPQTISVTGGILGVPGCANSNYLNAFTVTGQKYTYSLKAGETASTSFVAKADRQTEVSTSDTVNTPPGADHEITVSTCPADFSATIAPTCHLKSLYKGGVVRTTTTGSPDYYCQLNAGTTYYMNVRQVKYDDSNVNSCDPNYSSCEVKVQIQNY